MLYSLTFECAHRNQQWLDWRHVSDLLLPFEH